MIKSQFKKLIKIWQKLNNNEIPQSYVDWAIKNSNIIKKRYCENCDGVNSGGFYDDICIIQELEKYQQFLFDNGGEDYGCQVPEYFIRFLVGDNCD